MNKIFLFWGERGGRESDISKANISKALNLRNSKPEFYYLYRKRDVNFTDI